MRMHVGIKTHVHRSPIAKTRMQNVWRLAAIKAEHKLSPCSSQWGKAQKGPRESWAFLVNPQKPTMRWVASIEAAIIL
jgi:hypothetical protein